MDFSFFFDGWSAIVRTLFTGALAYLTLVVFLRISGKRTLSKWNAFDMVVTVSLGSSLATAVLSKDTAYAQVAVGFALLILLQFLVTWLSVRVGFVRRAVKSTPTLLVFQGQFCREAMAKQRVTESEVRAALREKGARSLEEIGALVLETDGSFSVLPEVDERSRSLLTDVDGYAARSRERV